VKRISQITWILILVAFAAFLMLNPGFSRSMEPPQAPKPIRHPDTLAQQIAGADRVVFSHPHRGSRAIFTGADARAIVRSISSAQQIDQCDCMVASKFEFYQGTNLLQSVDGDMGWYISAGKEYVDKSGTLRDFESIASTNQQAQIAWLNDLAVRSAADPGLPAIQEWCVGLLSRWNAGQVETNRRGQILEHEIPESVVHWCRSFGPFEPHISVYPKGAEAACVAVTLGEWGLLIGNTNYSGNFQAVYLTNATPGVFAYRSKWSK